MTRRLSRPVVVLLTAALIGAAFLVRLTQPSDERLQEPFVTTARFGQQVEGRDLTFEAESAYFADRLTSAGWVGETDGVWLVVEATIGAKLGKTSPDVSIRIGEYTYFASTRADGVALGGSLDAGFPQSGAFVFELPRDVLEMADADRAVARFANGFRVRLDSAIDIELDLRELAHERSATLPTAGVVLP